jgi:hypothetical protein
MKMLELITEDTKKTVEVCTSLKDERYVRKKRKFEERTLGRKKEFY